ncbi:hypothetical protein QJS04_geneDACA003309 [Acorus gramineus]|uniref:Uncharacterized protein n=1 Tax=Acorus gramineus TaxID=55184 RepID=A0AAV9BLG4_ACOGR|nr:hypothetical protein QJS04_geneDACA003309 [Acorus gramineus]
MAPKLHQSLAVVVVALLAISSSVIVAVVAQMGTIKCFDDCETLRAACTSLCIDGGQAMVFALCRVSCASTFITCTTQCVGIK